MALAPRGAAASVWPAARVLTRPCPRWPSTRPQPRRGLGLSPCARRARSTPSLPGAVRSPACRRAAAVPRSAQLRPASPRGLAARPRWSGAATVPRRVRGGPYACAPAACVVPATPARPCLRRAVPPPPCPARATPPARFLAPPQRSLAACAARSAPRGPAACSRCMCSSAPACVWLVHGTSACSCGAGGALARPVVPSARRIGFRRG
jgi:hypothetical protein